MIEREERHGHTAPDLSHYAALCLRFRLPPLYYFARYACSLIAAFLMSRHARVSPFRLLIAIVRHTLRLSHAYAFAIDIFAAL